MKKSVVYIVVITASFCLPACKKFLNIQPVDKLTGNNFYQSKDDVVANIYDLSRQFFGKINETHFIGATGEYRSGEVLAVQEMGAANGFVEALGHNDLLNIINNGTWGGFNLNRITDWSGYYKIIQGANILIAKLDEGIPGVSATDKSQFKGEAAFIRALAYFFMVRLYGDVAYYTDAFHSDALPRENMVSVLNKCIADLKNYKNDLPWTYGDPGLRGVRANRGSIIALLMNMNMWNAGFDPAKATQYYQETVDLGQELIKSNAFKLLPMTEWATVMKGKSDESLFEFYQSVNYGDAISLLAPVSIMFLHYPYRRPEVSHRLSNAYYRAEYMQKLYPTSEDKRTSIWFDENMYADGGKFMLLKFAQNTFATGEEDANPDNTFMIFRYAGEILLCAEAEAELGGQHNNDAIAHLNMVRTRAGAALYAGSTGQPLKDFIFLERSRELMGEGHHYFDLVRTKRILNGEWTYNVLTPDKFSRGAWTWPINASALSNNPFMALNAYWVNGGH